MKPLDPVLNPGAHVFVSLPPGVTIEPASVIASIQEPEGLTVVMREADAQERGLRALYRCAWITLSLNSDLEAVGLTAMFATALANIGISCNVIAGAYHDHIFVPVDQAEQALSELRRLRS
jgi:uncharacterized protein